VSHTEDQDSKSTKPIKEESNFFWKGLVIGAVIVLIPAILANQKQREFIALQQEVIDLYEEQSNLLGIVPEPDAAAVDGKPAAIPTYDPGLDIYPSQPPRTPEIYLGVGAILEVAENRTARVFGNDNCPDKKDYLFHSATGEGGIGCALLTGNKSIKVRLIFEDGSELMEAWEVNSEPGHNGEEFRLMRPNGWLVREPSGQKGAL
jgi:hypothetical protein